MSTTKSDRPQSDTPPTLNAEPPARAENRAEQPVGVDRSLLRLGATAGLVGVAVQVIMDRLHPHRIDPNDSPGVFREYAGSQDWTWVHIGQFAGTLMIIFGLIALARSLSRQAGMAGALGVVGAVAGVLVAAVFTVQMAVDGVALKAAIDAWMGAAPADHSSAFQVAESVRWTEKGLSGFFQMVQGVTLVALGLSIALGGRFPRWLGVVGALAGAMIIAGGTVTAHTGFSSTAGLILTPGTVLLAVFAIGTFIVMWRRDGHK
ncbi:MAG TPA: hypothetical protein VFP34_08700 [Microlunatus sp.]|nr:hypothetical protein [Microlunatus sp.]